jgi:uncharacterized protein YdaU (DUF1376 family)
MNPDALTVSLWMPWYVRDHRAEAMTLSHIEHSALVYLKGLFWERAGVLDDDDALIARALRITVGQWRRMRPILLQDCMIAGRQITHPWTVREVAKARDLRAQKVVAGNASAAARAKREANSRSTDVPTDVQPRAGRGEGEGPSQEGTVVSFKGGNRS